MATHSGILAWRIPGTEEHGGVYGVAQSRTRLKGLSSSSSRGGTWVISKYYTILYWAIDHP